MRLEIKVRAHHVCRKGSEHEIRKLQLVREVLFKRKRGLEKRVSRKVTLGLAEASDFVGQSGRTEECQAAAVPTGNRRPEMISGQVQSRDVAQLLLPISELFFEPPAAKPLLLPEREIGVPDGKRDERRGE